MPKAPGAGSPAWKVWNLLTGGQATIFRLTGGRLGATWGGAPVLLLHHVGAKSGKHRVSPVIYLADGENLVVVGSKGGFDRHPAWFHNLRAHPETEVEVPREGRRRVRARVASDEERDALWPRLVAMYRPYDEYQTYTDRKIPVVIFEPAP